MIPRTYSRCKDFRADDYEYEAVEVMPGKYDFSSTQTEFVRTLSHLRSLGLLVDLYRLNSSI